MLSMLRPFLNWLPYWICSVGVRWHGSGVLWLWVHAPGIPLSSWSLFMLRCTYAGLGDHVNPASAFVWDLSILSVVFYLLTESWCLVLIPCFHRPGNSIWLTCLLQSSVTVLNFARHSCNLQVRKVSGQEGLRKGAVTTGPHSGMEPGCCLNQCLGEQRPFGHQTQNHGLNFLLWPPLAWHPPKIFHFLAKESVQDGLWTMSQHAPDKPRNGIGKR